MSILTVATHCVLLTSLIVAAFAHTAFPPHDKAPQGFDERAYAAQYTLPDGTLPVLCDRTGNGGTHHPSTVPCEFCSLAATMWLPAPQEDIFPFVLSAALANPLIHVLDQPVQIQLGLHGASRAPPQLS